MSENKAWVFILCAAAACTATQSVSKDRRDVEIERIKASTIAPIAPERS